LKEEATEVLAVEARDALGRWRLWPYWKVGEGQVSIVTRKEILLPPNLGEQGERDAAELLCRETEGQLTLSALDFRVTCR
jgi:hypothetical protein